MNAVIQQMNGITLADRERAARFASLLFRFRSLDQVWTTYLDTAKKVPDSDVANLQAITDEMRQLLVSVSTEARWLWQMVEKSGNQIEHLLNQAIQATLLDSGSKQAAQQKLTGGSNILTAIRTRLDNLVNQSEPEATTLASKMRTISQGKFAPGDSGLLCAVGAALVIAGILTADPVAAGVGLVIVLGEC